MTFHEPVVRHIIYRKSQLTWSDMGSFRSPIMDRSELCHPQLLKDIHMYLSQHLQILLAIPASTPQYLACSYNKNMRSCHPDGGILTRRLTWYSGHWWLASVCAAHWTWSLQTQHMHIIHVWVGLPDAVDPIVHLFAVKIWVNAAYCLCVCMAATNSTMQ